MQLYISSLNSGSNANCYYIGNDTDALLIDAGLSCRETEKRMKLLGLSMKKVKGVFISHEHSDHINGLQQLSKKFQLPVYITEATLENSHIPLEKDCIRTFKHGSRMMIGDLCVHAFRKSHDAIDPHSFMISAYGINIGVITDIGHACKEVIACFSQCHAAFLESNYCEDMLANGNYPYHLKKRIAGSEGHLSNAAALELFRKHASKDLQQQLLSHLSKNNNRPELAAAVFAPHAGNTKIVVASRHEPSPVFCIELLPPVNAPLKSLVATKLQQLSLFQ